MQLASLINIFFYTFWWATIIKALKVILLDFLNFLFIIIFQISLLNQSILSIDSETRLEVY
jgi:hypothetical protein